MIPQPDVDYQDYQEWFYMCSFVNRPKRNTDCKYSEFPCARVQPCQIYMYTVELEQSFSQRYITISASQLTLLCFEQLFSQPLQQHWWHVIGWVGNQRRGKPFIMIVWTSYESQKCQPQAQTCLNGVNRHLPITGVIFRPLPSMQHTPQVPWSQL